MMENETCRILTISSTLSEATTFIESVKALVSGSSEPSESASASTVPLSVPWTITNRYYVADVHFWAWTVDKVFVELFDRQPPALVFVWSEGEEGYVEDVKEIARLMKLGEYEPEVALAVRIRGGERTERDGGENGDIDSMLMSCGFEYVDATQEGGDDDIPGLPRVVDALSTIMWPSMRGEPLEPEAEPSSPVLGFEDDFAEFVSAPYVALDSESEGESADGLFEVLREYKAEIAGMQSEEQRRMSAARVALQVVYGL